MSAHYTYLYTGLHGPSIDLMSTHVILWSIYRWYVQGYMAPCMCTADLCLLLVGGGSQGGTRGLHEPPFPGVASPQLLWQGGLSHVTNVAMTSLRSGCLCVCNSYL